MDSFRVSRYHGSMMLPDQYATRPRDVVLVYAWDAESRRLAEALCSGDHFGVALQSVAGTPPDSLNFGTQRIVGCVLFVSEEATTCESFAAVVSQCCDSRLLRSDFRLFAWLAGDLTADGLRKRAESYAPYKHLLESVHFPRHRAALTAGTVADVVDQYLSELTEYRQQAKAASEMKKLTTAILCFAGILVFEGVLAILAGWFCAVTGVRGPIIPWAMFGLGQLSYYVLLSMGSIGSTAEGGSSGWVIRICLAASSVPFLFIGSEAILDDRAWIAAGFVASLTGDAVIRRLAPMLRWGHFLIPGDDGMSVPPPGKPNWRLFFWGPLTPSPPRIFISYTESAGWSSRTASELCHELRNREVPVFFAPASIPAGSSWRHRLRGEISKCSLFVLVQDEVVMGREWPLAELHTACAQQARFGSPSVVVLRRPGGPINNKSKGLVSDCISATLSLTQVRRPGFAVVEYSPDRSEEHTSELQSL